MTLPVLVCGVAGLILGLLCVVPALTVAAEPPSLVAAGIERYRAAAYGDAIAIFNSVLAGQPNNAEARLYLSLSYMGRGDDQVAAQHLGTLRTLPISPRLRTQVDHVLAAMHAGPLTPPLRRFIAATLEETIVVGQLAPPRTFSERAFSRNFPYFP